MFSFCSLCATKSKLKSSKNASQIETQDLTEYYSRQVQRSIIKVQFFIRNIVVENALYLFLKRCFFLNNVGIKFKIKSATDSQSLKLFTACKTNWKRTIKNPNSPIKNLALSAQLICKTLFMCPTTTRSILVMTAGANALLSKSRVIKALINQTSREMNTYKPYKEDCFYSATRGDLLRFR